MKSVAVIYATREGQTRKIAERIQADLEVRGVGVDLQNVSDVAAFDKNRYGAVVLAASVHAGHHEKEMVNFVKAHRDELSELPTAFLSVSLSHAGYQRCACDVARREEFGKNVADVIDAFFRETGWHPALARPVAGALVYQQYNPFIRFVMRRIAAKAGADTDTSKNYEYTDWVDLDRFVDDVADCLARGSMVFGSIEPAPGLAYRLN